VELSIGTVKASIAYSTDLEKELILKTAGELNTEYNRLIISCGNVEESILLFFLLMKTEIKLQRIDHRNVDNAFFSVLKLLGSYVHEKNSTRIRESLVAIGIIKRIELNRKDNTSYTDKDEYSREELFSAIEKFGEEIKGNIKTIENNILLF
jgi:hypothetical protein